MASLPIAFQLPVVLQTWLIQLENFVLTQNQAAVTQFNAAYNDWKLNASIYKALGLAVPPAPNPPYAVAVNLVNGIVQEPEIITTQSLVCPIPTPPTPTPADPTPRLGVDMGNGFYAVPPGDSAPSGFVLVVGGHSYQKTIRSTPFGAQQFYQQIS